MFSRALGIGLIGVVLVGLSGCEERRADGTTTVYAYSLWSVLLSLGGGVAAFAYGWKIRRHVVKRFPIVLMTLGAMLVLFVAPTLLLHRVTVDDEHFTARGGFWLAPNYQEIRFEQLRALSNETGRSSRNKKVYQLVCTFKDGRRIAITSDMLLANAIPEILARARKQGVATPAF